MADYPEVDNQKWIKGGNVTVIEIMAAAIGIILALGITALVMIVVRGPLFRFLNALLDDEGVARLGVAFVILLLGLHGLRAALSFITVPELEPILTGIGILLVDLAGALQWAAGVAALLFIGYALRGLQLGGSAVVLSDEEE